MVSKNIATYEPAKQTRSVLLYWRLPEEWAEVLYQWVRDNESNLASLSCSPGAQASSTGQMNTILTFYDITDPPVESPLTNIPIPLLRKAITILTKSNRAQIIAIPDGEGVRFFAQSK
jgi:ESCRT-II complex subunit VPS25